MCNKCYYSRTTLAKPKEKTVNNFFGGLPNSATQLARPPYTNGRQSLSPIPLLTIECLKNLMKNVKATILNRFKCQEGLFPCFYRLLATTTDKRRNWTCWRLKTQLGMGNQSSPLHVKVFGCFFVVTRQIMLTETYHTKLN